MRTAWRLLATILATAAIAAFIHSALLGAQKSQLDARAILNQAGMHLPNSPRSSHRRLHSRGRRLVAHGAAINAQMTKEPRDGNRNMLNRIGATPFVMAAKSADVPLMRVLLESGADPKIKTNDGTSALMAAAGVGVYGPGESPGTHEEALEAVKLAYEVGGGDVNDANRDGETALLGAVYRGGAVPVIQFLADKGAKLDVANKKQWTPLLAAEGVVYASSGIRRYPEAAALIRKLMREKGLPIPEIERNGGDRKSTRLNSSHLGISYAVFCLK